MLVALLFLLVFAPIIAVARRSNRNDRELRSAGAIEPDGDVYAIMQLAYPLCFLAMIAEAWLRHPQFDGPALAGGLVFLAAKALKYWAQAAVTGPVALLLFGTLMLLRIRVEERALGLRRG